MSICMVSRTMVWVGWHSIDLMGIFNMTGRCVRRKDKKQFYHLSKKKSMNTDIKLELVNGADGPITILQGQAAEVRQINGYSVSGDIRSPYEFFKFHSSGQSLQHGRWMLEVDYEQGCIYLNRDMEMKVEQVVVSGHVKYDRVLENLFINKNKKFRPKELADMLKLHRGLFDIDGSITARDVVSKLVKFNANLRTLIANENDDRGNTVHAIEQTLDTEVPESFTLKWPIVSNDEPSTFSVDICAEVRDKSVSFFLTSVEMEEILREKKKALIDREVKLFDGQIPVIYK